MKEIKTPVLPSSVRELKSEEASVLTADPATFLIAMAIANRVRESVSELRKWLLEQRPELEVVLEKVLASMEQAGWIRIFGDRITVIPESLGFNMLDPNVASCLQNVSHTVLKRIQKNAEEDRAGNPSDHIIWAALPDHPKVRRRLAEIARQYKANLNQVIEECVDDPELKGDQCRYVMIMNGPLRPEDY